MIGLKQKKRMGWAFIPAFFEEKSKKSFPSILFAVFAK
jgi:hypothetical protein